jgi:hypothetical protein
MSSVYSGSWGVLGGQTGGEISRKAMLSQLLFKADARSATDPWDKI